MAGRGGQRRRSCGETLAAGAGDDGVGVFDFEAAALQVVAVIELAAGDEERALGINDNAHIGGGDHDVAVRGSIDEVHLVLQAGAAATDDGDAQRTVVGAALLAQQALEARGGTRKNFDELFAADFDVHSGG